MMMKIVLLTSLLLAVLPSTQLRADPLGTGEKPFLMCKDNNKGTWISTSSVVKKVEDMGYEVKNLKVEKGCYELKALDKEKNIFEFYIHPITGELHMQTSKPALP